METQEAVLQAQLTVHHHGSTYAAIHLQGHPMVLFTEQGRAVAVIHLVTLPDRKDLVIADTADTVIDNPHAPRGEVFCGITREDNITVALVITSMFHDDDFVVEISAAQTGKRVLRGPIEPRRSLKTPAIQINATQLAAFAIQVVPPPGYDWSGCSWTTKVKFVCDSSLELPWNPEDMSEGIPSPTVALWISFDAKVPLPPLNLINPIEELSHCLCLIEDAIKQENEKRIEFTKEVKRDEKCMTCDIADPMPNLLFVPCGHCYLHSECYNKGRVRECDLCGAEIECYAFL